MSALLICPGKKRKKMTGEGLIILCNCILNSSIGRESKELAEYTQMHPPMVSASGLNPNLVVTGGQALAGTGRWPGDPASHLASHHWLSRSGAPSMWLPGSHYGKDEETRSEVL